MVSKIEQVIHSVEWEFAGQNYENENKDFLMIWIPIGTSPIV